MLSQGFRGLPGRIGSPGLDGEKVRPELGCLIRPQQGFTLSRIHVINLDCSVHVICQHCVFAKQGDTGLSGTPGIPGLNGLTGRKVHLHTCSSTFLFVFLSNLNKCVILLYRVTKEKEALMVLMESQERKGIRLVN